MPPLVDLRSIRGIPLLPGWLQWRLRVLAVIASVVVFLVATRPVRAQEETVEPGYPDPESNSVVSDESALANDLLAPPVTTSIPVTIAVPNLKPGWQFHGGVLLLQPAADNLGWAVLTTEKNYNSPAPLATPYWQIETLRPGYSPGFEFGAGRTFARPGTDFQINWQHLRTSTSMVAGINQSDGQWISPFSQTGPPTADTYADLNANSGVNKLLNAYGEARFAYDAVNFDFGQYINVLSSVMVRMFAGLQYARVQERILSNFYGAPPPPDAVFPDNVPITISLDNSSTFSGVGPRLGFDTVYQTARGLRFTGQVAGALLIGPTQPAQYLFAGTSPELAAVGIPVNREGIYSKRFTHVVYAANAKLGVGYTRLLPGGAVFSVDGGYLAAIYLDAFQGYETNNNVLALQLGSLSTASMRQVLSNFSVNGFFINGGLTW